jgi:hypothetical protein
MFVRDDWTVFRNLATLPQKAGLPVHLLRRLVVKELVDNALDATGGKQCELRKEGNSYSVKDWGPGIPGGADFICNLFSIRRPLTSSKLLRLPTRGALGNGLRVVVGAVLATGGTLRVITGGIVYHLRPQDDGTTALAGTDESSQDTGTTVLVSLPGLPDDPSDLAWGELANTFRFSKLYAGRTNPFWYDSDSFYELCLSAQDRSPSALAGLFEGWGGGKGEADPDNDKVLLGLPERCNEVDRDGADAFLGRMREVAKQFPAKRIGGGDGRVADAYVSRSGYIKVQPGRGKFTAEIPYVVEAWAVRAKSDKDAFTPFVNGTPVATEAEIARQKPTEIAIWGCGLQHRFTVAKAPALVYLNIISPHVPITNDGKSPDFKRYMGDVAKCLTGATRKLKSAIKKEDQPDSQRDLIIANLRPAMRKASGNGQYRYSLRQLFYAVRPYILDAHDGKELDYNYFASVVTKYESDNGDLKGMYRDPRGNLYHPHTGETIPIGTLAVEEYKRPDWTFNKVLYCEKEGFVNMLVADGWPERNDCALLSSKGFASRAVRDVIDLMGEGEEEITFFCVHDADASGTLIYQSLQDETAARPGRKVKIINLGLDPWEALDMGLARESFDRKGRTVPVAGYIERADQDWRDEYQKPPAGFDSWQEWLQGHRVELNAMTSPQFINWLDDKMRPYNRGKVVPPEAVLKQTAHRLLEQETRRKLSEQILRDADIDRKVDNFMSYIKFDDNLAPTVEAGLEKDPRQQWIGPLASKVREAVEQA